MKKALSIILCLAMLMTTVPMSVFAAPSAVTNADSATEFVPELPNDDSAEAELAAEGTVMPVKVLPKNGETVDRRYPVAYYTFAKSVVINKENVTLENIGNDQVGGVYFDEETNTIWVFPATPMSTVYATNTVSYEAWTSNIEAEDGSLLYFPAVNFTLDTVIPHDGQNLVPFGNMEFGWSPFDHAETGSEGQFSLVQDPTDADNHVTLRTWKSGASKWPHAHVDAAWTPGSVYKIVAKVMVKDFVNDSGATAANATSSITPDLIYYVPSFSCTGKGKHPDQTGTVCTVCGAAVDREHATSFEDHMVNDKAPTISVTGGVSNGWQTVEIRDVVARENLDVTRPRAFSLYSNPYNNSTYAAQFYIDDVEIYEQVQVAFAAGRYSEKTGRGVTAKKGYFGDVIELPKTLNGKNGFNCTQEGYVIDGWTDGTNVYAVGEEYTITGPVTLTPNVVPSGDGYKVTFTVDEQFADYYAGPHTLSVVVDETIDLSEETYAIKVPVGYSVLGWKNAATGEFVTSVSGAKDEVINLVAVFELRTGIMVDTAAKAAELKVGNGVGTYDETAEGLKVTPSSKDPYVIFDNLAISADEYSFVDISYVLNDDLAAAGGYVYIDSELSKGVAGVKYSQGDSTVSYRYDLASNDAWIDVCSSIRIDPYNNNTEFTVTGIQFVKNEVVDEIAVSDLTAPAISATPDTEAVVPADAVYEITSISWTPADEYFMGSTEYTATVEIAINKSGYMFDEKTVALIGGKDAEVEATAKTATVTKTFNKTAAPRELVITLESADKITTNDGTLELAAKISPAYIGDVILPDTYTWAITGGDADIATLEGNVLTAKWNGTVEVSAIPDYDVTQAKAFDITITGQTGFTVTYEKNTGADVENMPTTERAKKDYKVSSMVPTRSGFEFGGWMTSPDANTTVTDIKVTKDITLYAKWVMGGYTIEFDKDGDTANKESLIFELADGNRFETSGVNKNNGQVHVSDVDIDTEKGEAIIVLGGGNDFYMTVYSGTEKPINIDHVKTVEYGFRTDAKGAFGYTFYFATKDPVTGDWIAPDHATGGQTYIDNKLSTKSTAVDGNTNTFYTVTVDTSSRDVWRGTLQQARLDIENSADFPGKTLYIDYIKFIGVESVENFELDIEAPKASDVVPGIEAVSTTSDKFEIKNITWEGPELVDGKYFAGASEYTAKVEVEAATGYALSDMPLGAFVNGEAAEIAVNGNKATITYTFPATETLEEIELNVRVAGGAPAEITESLGTLQLEERVVAVSGADIGNYEVYWSIDPSQKKYGSVDANGLVTGNTDCEALIVTATSKYDPSVKTSISIRVTGQIPEKNITFAAGTGEEVTGLPENTTAKDEYVLPTDVIPERSGYAFKGWSKELGGAIIKVDDVKKDTTYYAVWGSFLGEEMTGTNFVFNVGGGSHSFADGVLSIVPNNANLNEGVCLQKEDIKFREGRAQKKVATNDVEYLEIKTTIAPDNLELCVYVGNADADGNVLNKIKDETSNTRFYSNPNSYNSNPDQNIFNYVEQQGEWYIYQLPAKLFKNWTDNLYHLRLNFIQRDPTNSKYVYIEYPAGEAVKFDYIRFVGRDIPAMDITGISVPAVKGEASTTATVKQADAFKITNITWEPELLGGIFFGSGTEYKATIDVEILKGYKAFSNPPARVTVNGKTAEYKRFNNTKATITYTFPATEDVGDLALVNVKLHEKNDEGTVTETKQIFSGDDFNLDKFSASNNPTGKRWTGWSETEGGELISGTINITEDTDYYAFYEDIIGYDFANKYHKNEKNVKASAGSVEFDGAWVVVTPEYEDSKAVLTLDGMNISAADYDFIEVIYDGSLEDANNDNRFNEKLAPVLKVNNSVEVALIKAEPVIASNRVSYKYTYDLTVNGKPTAINSFNLAPYQGKPSWAVTSVMLVPNAGLEEAVAVTGIKAPETWLKPDVSAEASENYVIDSISWNSENGFNDDGSYKSETAYTVTIVVKPATGSKITVEAATIDGTEADEVVLGTDGKLTIKKTYPATAALVDFELTVADAEINVADGTVKLVPEFSAEIDVKTVKWEIVENGPEGKSATIDENGVVKAYFDGDVKVKATSDYNPLVSAEATVTITNQIAAYNVTFDANTTSTVTNMPANVQTKLDYTLPTQIPVREGFEFAGWVKTPDGTASIVKDYITEKTTYYALWVRGGLHYEFFDANENSDKNLTVGTVEYWNVDTENGVMTFQPKISAYNSLDTVMNIENKNGKPLFKGSDYPKLVVRMTSTMDSAAGHKVYYKSVDANGKALVPSYSEADAVTAKASVGPAGYTDIVIDMSAKSGWMDGYITSVRFDPIDSGASMAHLNAVMSIDYIRAVSYETGVIEVTGVDAPVAKATADTTAESKDPSKYVVTNVEWEGGLIYDYYFGGETVYTACVTVKGAPGYVVSDAPTKATVNGKDVALENTSYNPETGELTLKYTFPATGAIDSDLAHELTLVGKDDNGSEVYETRTIFNGEAFNIGTYLPASIPAGKRWIGWSENADATSNELGDSVVVTEAKTYYAVFEDLVEFDYSNYYHTFGTTIKSNSGTLTFEDGLAVVEPAIEGGDTALITPVMNVDGENFGLVEVYYSALLDSENNGIEYPNIFSSVLKPVLKFSTTKAPDDCSNEGVLVGAEKVKVGSKLFFKYTYDMSGVTAWASNNIAKLYLDPYNGFPNWGVGFIKLVENEPIFDAAEIKLDAPESWAAPATADSVSISDKYEITGVEWTPAAEVFAAETAYTVKVTYKPVAGYKVSDASATINGEAAIIKNNGNGTYTASYTFEMTESLKDVKVVITGNSEIKSKGRYLELKGETVALDGTKLPVTNVTWSVKSKGTNTELATISENGRIYPISNGTVIVTATSVYNPKVTATHEVKITNQADLVKVTFDKNTHADVQGMPEAVYVYGKFEPENYNITRDGFFFAGWSVDEDALTPDKSFNITEDTTLYAKWGAGYEYSFNDASTAIGTGYREYATFKNGIGTYGPAKDGASQIVGDKGTLAKSLGIETATHTTLEIRLNPSTATVVKFYLQSADEEGKTKSPWNETASKGSTTSGTVAEGWQVVSFDLTAHANWNMYPYFEQIRLDLPQCAPAGSVDIDYIRLLTKERSVKFDGNGGLIPLYGGEVTSFKETYLVGTINLPADPTREGYEFLGWAKKTEGYTKLYNNKFTVTDETILYAIWTPAAVLDETTVEAEGAEITANENNGNVTITSAEETTPVVSVADVMDVGNNQTIVVEVNADYASTTDGKTILSFVTEDGTPVGVVLDNDGLSGKETLIVDLSEHGFEGTVTDVELKLPAGIINSLEIRTVAFATSEDAKVFDNETKETVSINPTVTVTQGGKPAQHPGHVSYPSLGGGTVTENSSSTTKTPTDKKVSVPARPKDDTPAADNNKPSTPTASSKYTFTKTYDGRFTDVTSANWFYGDVEKSYKLGLMNGKSDTEFAPEGTVTLAEAITVAARIRAIYYGDTIAQGTGNNWYAPYVEYATKKAIITSGQYSDYTALATREQVATMFVRALPASWYTEMNLFKTIPDVPANSASFAAIQRLYNAGVVTGVDAQYNFKPAENIKRSELSAIINRVALPDSRLRVITEDEKNNKDKKFGVAEIMSTLTLGNCVDKEWVEKNGGAFGQPAKPDPVALGLQDLMGGTLNANEYKTITVVLASSKASSVVGQQAQLFFSTDGTLSEANSLRTKIEKNADGTLTAKFNGNSNAGWKGDMTLVRFDPWNNEADFAIISITFAP